jgi:molybdopterin molybdotransferase
MKADLISFEQAVVAVLAQGRPLAQEGVPLAEAHGRILALTVAAPFDVPRDSASLMDGYAVRASALVPGASLRVAFDVPAGKVAPRPLAVGECARILTGAPLPSGSDAVVKQEDVVRDGGLVRFPGRVHAGEHVRSAGSDARSGQALLNAGSWIDAGALSLAASVGMTELQVIRRPTVAILATGDELRLPGTPLSHGTIYESNSVGMAAQAREAGAAPVVLATAPDNADAIADRFEGVKADVFVTSGGASVGDFDFARDVLERLGGRLIFWQVAIRPGKPILFGAIERRSTRSTLFFALPGNPAASALTFDLLIRPVLRAMTGARPARRQRVKAKLESELKKPEGLTCFVRGTLVADGGTLLFRPAALQGSMSIASLHGLGGVAVVPPEVSWVAAGAMVDVEPWQPLGAE